MRIVIFSSFFYPHVGGLERNNWQIAKRLAKTNNVSLVTCNTEAVARAEVMDGINVVRLDCWNFAGKYYPVPKLNFYNLKQLRLLFKEKPVAVISNTRFYILTLMSAFIAKLYRVKYIHIERGANHPVHPSRFVELVAKTYDWTFGRLALALADEIGGQSQAALDFVKSLGIRNKPMFVAYNGIELGKFEPSNHNFNKVLFVGRLIKDKGCQDLIRAFKKIENEFAGTELLIAGEGPHRSTLENLAKGSNIKFLGHLDYQEILKFYSQSGVYVSLSYSNGLSTTILEAGASGLVVLATNQSGVRELIDKDKGYLFEIGDIDDLATKLKEILKNKPIKKGLNLKSHIEKNFDWNKLVSGLEKRLKA